MRFKIIFPQCRARLQKPIAHQQLGSLLTEMKSIDFTTTVTNRTESLDETTNDDRRLTSRVALRKHCANHRLLTCNATTMHAGSSQTLGCQQLDQDDKRPIPGSWAEDSCVTTDLDSL